MGPLRILIFGINYWPEQTGIAPYTTGLAEHLVRCGARVTVLTGMPHYPHWRVFDGYRGRLRLREEINGVEVWRFRGYVPPRQSVVRRALFEATFLAHAMLRRGLPRPDLVLGSIPSLSGGVLAAVTAKRSGLPYGIIFQDLVGCAAEQSGMPNGDRVAKPTRAIEGWVARGASGVAVVSDGFRPYLEELGVAPERIDLLRNWSHIAPPSRPRAEVRARLGWSDNTTIVLHAGAMGLKQGLEQVVTAARIAWTTRPHLRFVLMGDGNQRARLERLATDCPNVTFLDPRPADEFPDTLAAADILLVSERGSVVDMSLPSKLTSYCVAGRPIVAAVPPHGGTAREVARSGAGLIVPAEDAMALLDALDRLVSDQPLTEYLAATGSLYADQHLSAAASLTRAERFVARLVGNLSAEPLEEAVGVGQ